MARDYRFGDRVHVDGLLFRPVDPRFPHGYRGGKITIRTIGLHSMSIGLQRDRGWRRAYSRPLDHARFLHFGLFTVTRYPRHVTHVAIGPVHLRFLNGRVTGQWW